VREHRASNQNNSKLSTWICTKKEKRKHGLECKAAQEEKDKARTKVVQNPSEDNKSLLAQKQKDARN